MEDRAGDGLLKILSAPWRWLWRNKFKLIFVLLCLFVAYLVYLDAQIRPRFEGAKWQVPAQIYARPLRLSVTQEITPNEIIDELELLGYRSVTSVSGLGEYQYRSGILTIYRRAFYYPNETLPARKIRITWRNERIESILDIISRENLEKTSLEPWLVSRLVSGAGEDRMLVDQTDIPELLTVALVEVEDKSFYQHHGIAPLSIVRALMANLRAGRTVQGGSTLTQQLVKNLFLTRAQTYRRKLQEAAMAIVIDARYSKQEILQTYINEVFLGQNGAVAVHGFGLASHFYFNKPLHELNISEIATLVAMVKGPSYYDPKRHPKRVTERRNLVLRILFEQHYINRFQYEDALNQALVITKSPSLASGKHPAFMDKVRTELKHVLFDDNKQHEGVKLFTTLDINAQRRAEHALKTTLDAKSSAYKQPNLQGAMLVSDIQSGGIRAMVGGRQVAYAGFNRAIDAYRQVGSLIKPVVFLRALEQPARFNLATVLQDKPISYDDVDGKIWRPQNADQTFREQVNLIDALVHSYNVPSINLAALIGFDEVSNTLNRLGVERYFEPLPSIALGAVELSPLQVNQIYQIISNQGLMHELHVLDAVSTHDDHLIWKRSSKAEIKVDEDAVYLLNYALHKVTQSGTAKKLATRFANTNMAGKTGTTDDYRDSWFSGFDRNLVSSIWMGNDDNTPINMSGATGALDVFIAFQSENAPKTLVRRFPNSLTIAHFDKTQGFRTLAGCPDVISLPAIKYALEEAKGCTSQPVEIKQERPRKKSWWERLFGS